MRQQSLTTVSAGVLMTNPVTSEMNRDWKTYVMLELALAGIMSVMVPSTEVVPTAFAHERRHTWSQEKPWLLEGGAGRPLFRFCQSMKALGRVVLHSCLLILVRAGDLLRDIQVTLRGDVFYVSEVSTVQDLQKRLEEESGLNVADQGSVTFQGKVLDPKDQLAQAGLRSGDQVNMVPKKMADHWNMINDMGRGLISLQQRMMKVGIQNISAEEMAEYRFLMNLYGDLTKVPYMQEEMEQLAHHLKNPVVVEQATDPDRVEVLRQIILNNPGLLKMLSESSPSTKVALQDPDIWLHHVATSVEEWKTMDGYQLWQRIVEGRLFGT